MTRKTDLDIDLESYLRSFTPRRPAPIELATKRGPRFVAATAALAASLALIAVIMGRHSVPRPTAPVQIRSAATAPITIGQLNRAASEGRSLEDALTLIARQTLPPTNQPNTALSALAKE
jgi:hypothetical protein